MQGDTAAAQANGQAGARPCKMTVGDVGTEAKAVAIRWYTSGLHSYGSTFIRTFQSSKEDFFWTVRRKQEYFNLFINTLY